MSQRKDAKITTKGKRAIVRVPNASLTGYGKWVASPGDFITFEIPRDDGSSDRRHGRVIGRVDAAGWDGGKGYDQPIKGHIAVVMLGVDLSFAHEMWVDPAWVTRCETVSCRAEFFRVFFTADPQDLLRMSEYGSLGAAPHRTNKLPPRCDGCARITKWIVLSGGDSVAELCDDCTDRKATAERQGDPMPALDGAE